MVHATQDRLGHGHACGYRSQFLCATNCDKLSEGKWVVLLGDRVPGMEDDLKTAMLMAQAQQYEGTLLVYHLE